MNTRKTAATPAARATDGQSAPTIAPAAKLAAHLRYEFEPGEQRDAVLDNPLFELLAALTQTGSIAHAARALDCSYRYVWGALRKWEGVLGEPLVSWAQGRKARPTEFARRLAWAERRARVRMQPQIEALRSDLTGVLAVARDARNQLLTLHASHDMALPVLQQYAAGAESLHLDLRFQGSVDALRALKDEECLLAGFHAPVLEETTALTPPLLGLLQSGVQLIACSRRLQGIMVRKEHAAFVHSFADLVRHRLRFVNRQAGSGTRMLVEQMMREHALRPAELDGYAERIEHTHVSVALCVASGVADAGIGIQAAALQFGLRFLPVVTESYYLACLSTNVRHPAIERLREILAGQRWQDILAGLPGYRLPDSPGRLLSLEEALPQLARGSGTLRRAHQP